MNAISSPQVTPDVLTQADIADAIRATALLADVSISVWSAERSDASIMERAKRDAGATGHVGRAIKNLLAGCDAGLKDTRSAYQAVRATHYALTLPWVSDPHAERQRGPRLLPTALFQIYLDRMSKAIRAAKLQLDAFIAQYPELAVQAQANLGQLAGADEYPSVDEVRRQFRAKFDFEPIPSAALFQGLPDVFREKLSRSLAAKQAVMLESAQSEMWNETATRLKHLTAKLSDPEARFKSGTVENVRELLTLLPGWNVGADPRVTEIVNDISRMIGGVDSDAIRKTDGVRKDVAEQATGIVHKLAGWGL